jgi:hypothetical protein
MSSDLLAEFDSFYQAPQKKQTTTSSAANDLSSLGDSRGNNQAGAASSLSQWQTSTAQPSNNTWSGMTEFPKSTATQSPSQDEVWGSFENGASQSHAPSLSASQPSYGGFTKNPVTTASQNKPEIVRRPTIDLFSSRVTEPSYRPPPSATILAVPRSPAVSKSSYEEVLFDAEKLDEDDDDFGDFETGAPEPDISPRPTSQSPTGNLDAMKLESKAKPVPVDLLSVTDSPNGGSLLYPQAPKSPSYQERNPFAEMGVNTKQTFTPKAQASSKCVTPITAWPSYESKLPKSDPYIDSQGPENEEEWGDFADLPAEPPAVQPTNLPTGIEEDSWGWDGVVQTSEPTPAPKDVTVEPPTNIPPPSVILSLFPTLFDLPQSTLFKAVAKQPFSLKNRIISEPTTGDFLRAYLLIATVAARIIAGRKLRWKRDTLLSQAMKIGPSAAGGKGGMKLAGVDKAEITREDREATDVVRIWKEHLGRLRSAIAVANSSIPDDSVHLAIPDISENMYVKTQDGGITASKQCLICGLKREERINKVDVQVEDSFGEWWVEHWGHRTCRNFWLEHESKLKHR